MQNHERNSTKAPGINVLDLSVTPIDIKAIYNIPTKYAANYRQMDACSTCSAEKQQTYLLYVGLEWQQTGSPNAPILQSTSVE